jgi:hypothetical protein
MNWLQGYFEFSKGSKGSNTVIATLPVMERMNAVSSGTKE